LIPYVMDGDIDHLPVFFFNPHVFSIIFLFSFLVPMYCILSHVPGRCDGRGADHVRRECSVGQIPRLQVQGAIRVLLPRYLIGALNFISFRLLLVFVFFCADGVR
jgi:hypothetical protein